MEIKEFDRVLLKDGREADIMDFLGPETFVADVGSSPADWDTILIGIEDIERVL